MTLHNKTAKPWDVGALPPRELADYEKGLTPEELKLFRTFRDRAHKIVTEKREAERKEAEVVKQIVDTLEPGWHKIEFDSPVTGKKKELNILKQ